MPPSATRYLLYSRTGATLVVWSQSGWRLLDARSGELLAPLPDYGPVADLAFTPDGRRLLAVGPRGATLFDARTAAVVEDFHLRPHAGPLTAVAVAADGLTAVAAGTRGRLARWDLPA